MEAIIFTIIATIITFLLTTAIVVQIEGDSSSSLQKVVKEETKKRIIYDLVISLCIISISIYLLFLIGPLLGEIERHRIYREEADWFTYITGISSLTVFIFYLLGIYTIMRLLTRTLHLTGRRLYYWTIGIFIFAFWVFAIHGITIWGR